MLKALYSSATGMRAQETMIDVTANNLANVNTHGFKRSHVNFADLLYSTVRQAGTEASTGQELPTGLQVGSGARPVSTSKNFSPGTIQQTNNTFDIAIEGEGFFKVLMPSGEFRYTRNGAFSVDSTGRMVTPDGHILDGGITISPDVAFDRISIGTDGTVTGVPSGSGGNVQNFGRLQLVKFMNPAGLSSEGGNLFSITPAAGPEVLGDPAGEGFGSLRQGYLEGSNVEIVNELIALISAQRAYEINSRAIRAGDQMLSTTSEIVR
ncbi:MAG: flagellar basal-body rod protein FlgG [Planctomyces sp.]|nr:flagellar basal-body rod protein FlgG [Planctomyces sp.]